MPSWWTRARGTRSTEEEKEAGRDRSDTDGIKRNGKKEKEAKASRKEKEKDVVNGDSSKVVGILRITSQTGGEQGKKTSPKRTKMPTRRRMEKRRSDGFSHLR